MKRVLSTILILNILFFSFITCKNKESGDKEKKELVKVGANLTLTGDMSYVSNELKKGIDIAYDLADNKIKSNVEILFEDNGFSNKKAISVFNKFIKVQDINVAITAHTPMAETIKQQAEDNKIPLIATFVAATDFAKDLEWIFKDFRSQKLEAKALANYTYDSLNHKKGSYIVTNDDYGREGAHYFESSFRGKGGVITNGQIFTKNSQPRNIVLKALKDDPSFVFIVAREKNLINLCKRVREMDKNIQIIGTAFDTETVWQGLGSLKNGIIYTSINVDNIKDHNFYKYYIEKYDMAPNYVAAYGYSIANYIFHIINNHGGDRSTIRNQLEQLDFNSIRGRLVTDDYHNIISPIDIFIRKDNKSVVLKSSV